MLPFCCSVGAQAAQRPQMEARNSHGIGLSADELTEFSAAFSTVFTARNGSTAFAAQCKNCAVCAFSVRCSPLALHCAQSAAFTVQYFLCTVRASGCTEHRNTENGTELPFPSWRHIQRPNSGPKPPRETPTWRNSRLRSCILVRRPCQRARRPASQTGAPPVRLLKPVSLERQMRIANLTPRTGELSADCQPGRIGFRAHSVANSSPRDERPSAAWPLASGRLGGPVGARPSGWSCVHVCALIRRQFVQYARREHCTLCVARESWQLAARALRPHVFRRTLAAHCWTALDSVELH